MIGSCLIFRVESADNELTETTCNFGGVMRVRNAPVFVLVCLVGCTPAPVVTKGTFNSTYTLTMQRGSVDVVVQTSGPASYTLTNYGMAHPMGPRPDTEATFTTPAGTFVVSDRNQKAPGLTINGVFYLEPAAATGRSTITIDAQGVVTVNPPKEPAPRGDKP
jgi:hypothetical protein